MEKNLRINYLGIEVSNKFLSVDGREIHKISYSDAIDRELIKGDKDGWRLPTIEEWRFLSTLKPLGIYVFFPYRYYLTSEADPDYVPSKIRDTDPEILNKIEEDPSYLEESGIASVFLWDTHFDEEYPGNFDEDSYPYIMVREFPLRSGSTKAL